MSSFYRSVDVLRHHELSCSAPLYRSWHSPCARLTTLQIKLKILRELIDLENRSKAILFGLLCFSHIGRLKAKRMFRGTMPIYAILLYPAFVIKSKYISENCIPSFHILRIIRYFGIRTGF